MPELNGGVMNTVGELIRHPSFLQSREDAIRLFYSSAVNGEMSGLLGAPHYSYRFAEEKFVRMFAQHRVAAAKLEMPEYYTSSSLPGMSEGHQLHLIFRSTEQIRLMKPAYNIGCFAWEFDVLKQDTAPGEHPFLNQRRMLQICQEVWSLSRYAVRVLGSHGVSNAHFIPAPVNLPRSGRADRGDALGHLGEIKAIPLNFNFLLPRERNLDNSRQGARTLLQWFSARIKNGRWPRVYLAVLNPEDFRKNIDAMLRGFYHFQREYPDVCLIVKALTAKNRFSLEDIVADVVPNKMASGTTISSENIIFINEYLSDDEMTMLYSLADFYLCTSIAEGQNLPLLEAMAHGTVPVTTCNTAMEDYINEDRAFVIETQLVENHCPHLAGATAGKPFRIALCSARDVFEALKSSRRAVSRTLAAKAASSVAAVREHYTSEAVWPLIISRMREIFGHTRMCRDEG